MGAFDGRWKVRRESGLLPPFGIRKSIHGGSGWTKLGPIPVLPFRVEGLSLRYRGVPIRDDLSMGKNGSLRGVAYFLGLRFCRFRMEPA